MKLIQAFALFILSVFFNSCDGTNKTDPSKEMITVATEDTAVSPDAGDPNIYSRYLYTDSSGKQLTIHNGYPRGGINYKTPGGQEYGYVLFWSRIINDTDNPIELNIDFPDKLYEISNVPGKYFKIMIPADTMTPDKIPLFLYGLSHADSFISNNIHKPTSVQRTIHSKSSSGFYFLMLVMTNEATGMTRTALNVKGQNLFYKISRYSSKKPVTLIDEKEIPCGAINLKYFNLHK